MAVIIGSARIDEHGKAKGGAAGDQKQIGKDDYRGEVSFQSFYVHTNGWYILRPKSTETADKMADLMILACNNPNIGYDQNQRDGVLSKGIMTTTPTECDCSSLVRACIKEATGKDPGNFTTQNEADILEKTGLFEKRRQYVMGATLYPGDVLVTKTKGHTVIVVSGAIRKATAMAQTAGKTVSQLAREVIIGKWGNGSDRKRRITEAGYDYEAVRAEVNRLLNPP